MRASRYIKIVAFVAHLQYFISTPGLAGLASSLIGSVIGKLFNVLSWSNLRIPIPQQFQTQIIGLAAWNRNVRNFGISGNSSPRPGEAIRETRILNYSARKRGVVSDEGDGEREKNWLNWNGLAQEAPARD